MFSSSIPGAVTRGPYLQVRTTTNIVIRWRTDLLEDSQVWLGTDPAQLAFTFSNPEVTTEHSVLVSGLVPETKYFYAIGNNSHAHIASTNFFFSTAPPIGSIRPTRIWFVSDFGFQNEGEAAVRDSYLNIAATRPADVWLTGGDNDQFDGSDERYQGSVFEYYAPLLQNTPIWPTIGNHDSYTWSFPGPHPYYDNFTLPVNGEAGGVPSGSEHYYSFDYANIHFICLDSIDQSLSSSANTPMTVWLQQDLAQTLQRWIIAYWHGPPYTKGSHDSDSPWDTSAWLIQMRENILPILESYGVDLVLNGHSHVYERSYLLHGHYGYSGQFSPTNKVDAGNGQSDGTGIYPKPDGYNGTVYVVAGVGGSPCYCLSEPHPAHVTGQNELGSCLIDVTGNRLDFQFLTATGGILDHFTILKESLSAPPAVPSRLAVRILNESQVQLSWPNTSTNELGFELEHSSDGTNFILIARPGANLTVWLEQRQALNSTNYYRIRAWNDAGYSPYSNQAILGTPVPQNLTIIPESGGYWIRFDGLPGETYRILVNQNLAAEGWEELDSVTAGAFGACELFDPAQGQQRFYRAVYP